jgi:phenylpyruvate tautomerase PptA (4-oxalocrotonate tautomerase family)
MEFSIHYSPFLEKTVIILTNTEKARVLSVEGREVTELDEITIKIAEMDDFEAQKAAQIIALAKKISKTIEKLLGSGHSAAMLCVPEVNREQLFAAMDPATVEKIATVIPKNLCAMKLDVVMRIILES